MTVHPWFELPSLLLRLDECLAAAVPNARARYGVGIGSDPYRGLYVGDDLVERLLASPFSREPLGEPDDLPWPPLGRALVPTVALDEFETAVVVLALGPDLDLKYERIYGYLQDDVTARRPRVALALDLFCPDLPSRLAARDRFAPDAPLVRDGILRLGGTEDTPLLARTLQLDPQFTRLIIGGTGLDERLAGVGELLPPGDADSVPLHPGERLTVQELLVAARSGRPVRAILTGSDLRTLGRVAHSLAGALELPLLRVPVGEERLPVPLLVREAMAGTALHLDGLPDPADLAALAVAPVALVTTDDPVADPSGAWRVIEFSAPGAVQRRELWRTNATGLAEADLDRLAARYRLNASQIASAARTAAAHTLHPGFGDYAEAARRQTRHRLDSLATFVPVMSGWSDLVLPPDAVRSLHELCDRVQHRALVMNQWDLRRRTNGRTGVNALFAGGSGTGKTTAAQVIAGELGLDLFTIDLSRVVSKYIGETEKNLDSIFSASAETDAVLFFDEADALFGKRSAVRDSHDRYANLEISYLLQRMEAHDGVAILATNLRQNLDEAFLRRLDFTIRFPFPEKDDRRRIWEQIWPARTPVGQLDVEHLAHTYKLSGGNIRNIAVNAAFLAAARGSMVEMADVEAAIDREFEKLGASSPLQRAR